MLLSSGAVIGMCPWGVLVHAHISVNSIFSRRGACAFFQGECPCVVPFFMYIHRSVVFRVASTSFSVVAVKAQTHLPGNWRCHIGFQQEIRRGASLLLPRYMPGKLWIILLEECVCPCDFCTSIGLVPKHLDSCTSLVKVWLGYYPGDYRHGIHIHFRLK